MMFKSLLSVVVPILLAAFVAAQDLTINTPTTGIVLCQPLLITWSGGTPPYFVSLLPGGQPSATPLVDFGRQTGTSLTWTVNQPAGTSLGLTIRDSTGKVAQSAPFTVTASSDTSCLSSTSGATSRTGSGSTIATTPGTTTTVATPLTTTTSTPKVGTLTTTTTPATGAGTTKAAATSASPSATGSGAWSINNYVARSALVGVVGAAVIAIFA